MKKLITLSFLIFVLLACQTSIKKENLIGKWTYTKYESLNKASDNSVDLAIQKPYIVFKVNGVCEIYSSQKLLSHGTFHLENNIIRYEEVLKNGIHRKIPFLIKKLDARQLIFQTMDNDVKVITAKKIHTL